MAEHDPARRPADFPLQLRTARDLPHSLESEQAVLGAVLVEETAFDQVAASLKASDFYLLAHQHVYAACEELARESKTLDPILVQQRLDAKGLLGAAVPRDLPLSLGRAIGTTANVAHYARNVQDLARIAHEGRGHRKGVEQGAQLLGGGSHRPVAHRVHATPPAAGRTRGRSSMGRHIAAATTESAIEMSHTAW